MHLVEFFCGWGFVTDPFDFGPQFHPCNCQSAFRILFHMTDRVVGVLIEDKLLFTRDGKEREHVATGERRDECFFRVDVRRISQIRRRGCRGHGMATIEAPSVITRIFLIRKFSAAALPMQGDFVFRHALQ